MGIILVAGVHGVGKTSCCKCVAELTGVLHLAASSLIKTEREEAISTYSKEVSDVPGNQELLIQGVQKLLAGGEGRIILDGHFTLLNTKGEIETVDLDVFGQFRLDGIVVYQGDPQTICDRLRERDHSECSVATLAAHQAAEKEHAQFIATTLNVSISCLQAFDTHGLAKVIGRLWGL